jgi:hypothetical protein
MDACCTPKKIRMSPLGDQLASLEVNPGAATSPATTVIDISESKRCGDGASAKPFRVE